MSTHIISGISNVTVSDASVLSEQAQSYIRPSSNSQVFRDEDEKDDMAAQLHPIDDDDNSSEDDEEPEFGHMTEKTFNKLAAKYNMNDLGANRNNIMNHNNITLFVCYS